MEFNEKLRLLRRGKGISQQALADAIFVSRSAVAKWENGLGLPSDESLQRLLEYFCVERKYFYTEEPEAIIVEKNKKNRRLFIAAVSCVVMLFAMLVLFVISIPFVNDACAILVEEQLQNITLPEDSALVDSLSCAGKMVGSGNGMQYLGAILIKSDLQIEQLQAHYANYYICRYSGGELPFVEHRSIAFDTQLNPDSNYYIVYNWGNGIAIYRELDIRGH